MSTGDPKVEKMTNLVDVYLAELMEMTDEDLLYGDSAQHSKASGIALLDSAKAEAGRRRLSKARDRSAMSSVTDLSLPNVSVADARAFLRLAANDSRYTLAAREMGEMSDDDVIRLYQQLKQLQLGIGDSQSKS